MSYEAATNTLTLDNTNISGSWGGSDYTRCAAIFASDVTINLIGNNIVTNNR